MPRLKKHYLILLVLIVIFGSLISVTAFPLLSGKAESVSIPVPNSLSRRDNQEVTTLDLWFPVKNFIAQFMDNQMQLTAKSALAYDLTSNSVLYEKDPTEKLPMASITKIMTAVVALEHPQPGSKYLVTPEALVGEDSMGLSSGEILSQQELLYGLLLPSGNDAAEVLAANFPGGRAAFIQAMNKKAESIGLVDTHFSNPTGLQGDGLQQTTAYDLVILTRYALENFPLFRLVVSTVSYTIPQTPTHKEYDLENETNLLTSYPGVQGVKTGYTPEAGLCLVTYLRYGGHEIIGVVLGSEDRRDDMKELLDYSLKKLRITPPKHG